jgi:Protein of unknown function (DUF3558)
VNTPRLVVLAAAFALSGCAWAGTEIKPVEPYVPVSTTPADTAACRLFDPAQFTEHRFKNGYASGSRCYWGADDVGSLMISLREVSTPEAYLAKPEGLRTSPITIGTHSGVVAENSSGEGSCGVVLSYSGGVAAAEMLTTAGGKACEIAEAVMKVIEPKLPS